MLKLVVRNGKAILVEVRKGRTYKVASFSADGMKWWLEAVGTEEIGDSWHDRSTASKAYVFARVYPHTKNPHRLAEAIREMGEFEAMYWRYAILQFGMKAVAAFKKLFDV